MASILVVDDSEYQRNLVAHVLSRAEHKVYQASDGRSALHVLESQPMDCVFTDIHMPEMDGYLLLKSLKEKNICVPVIVLTADNKPETTQILRDLGAKGFMAKPVKEENLLKLLNAVLHPKVA
jgi:CheY-like chemotaxis protein